MAPDELDNLVLQEIIRELIDMGYSPEEAAMYAPAMMRNEGDDR